MWVSSAVSHYSFIINVGIQNILQESQETPTQSAVRSAVMVMDLRAGRRIYLTKTGSEEKGGANSQDARPRSTACRNASPADCGPESFANVPAFIDAKTFAGFVSFCTGPPGSCGAPLPKPLPLP